MLLTVCLRLNEIQLRRYCLMGHVNSSIIRSFLLVSTSALRLFLTIHVRSLRFDNRTNPLLSSAFSCTPRRLLWNIVAYVCEECKRLYNKSYTVEASRLMYTLMCVADICVFLLALCLCPALSLSILGQYCVPHFPSSLFCVRVYIVILYEQPKFNDHRLLPF